MTTKQINKIYSDIDLSFSANPITGDISRKYDVNAVKQSLKTLILTQYYERPFQPKLGSPVYGLLFENIDMITANTLKLQIELMINKYEPRVRSQEVTVEPLDPIFHVEPAGLVIPTLGRETRPALVITTMPS